MSCAMAVTFWIDAPVSWIDAAVSATEVARLAALAVTCSIELASSLADDTSSSADAATDSACPAVSRSDADISFNPLSTPSTAVIWTPAPSDTSSVVRAMISADAVTRAAWSRMTAVSNAAGCFHVRC